MDNSFSSAFKKTPQEENPNSFSSAFKKQESPNQKAALDSSIARDIGSLTTGVVSATPYGLISGGLQAFGTGEALAEREELAERIPELMEKFPTAPWKEEWKQKGFDPEQFKQEYDVGLKAASESFPSVGNIASWVEKATGLPFTPQTPFQHLLNFMGSAAKFSPGDMGEKAVRTAAAGATREALIQSGLPEPVADTFAYATLLAKKDQIGADLIKQEKETAAKKASEPKAPLTEPPPPPGGSPPPPPPTGKNPPPFPPSGSSLQVPPSEGRITAPAQYLKSDYEIAEDIKKAVSPLTIHIEQPTNLPVAREATTLLRPVEEELNQIAPHRVSDPRLLGAESGRAVQRVSDAIYKDVNKDWANFRSIASDMADVRSSLAHNLTDIIQEHKVPQTQTSAKVLSMAQRLRRRAKRPLTNEELADAIIEARKEFKYNIHGGQESHRINEYIKVIENELKATMSPEEAAAYKIANESYANWAQTFKDKQILPYRYTNLPKPRSLYDNALKPDTLQKLIPILEQDPTGRGKTLADSLKRNLVENTLSPYLTNLKGINPFRFQTQMGKLKGIIDDSLLQEIEQSVADAHLQALHTPNKQATGGFKSKYLDMDESQVSRYLSKVSGLKELEQELSQVPGGKELFDNIKKTKGIDLLFGGQMDIPSRSNNLSKHLNDRNGQYYIKYTLGDKVYEELKQLEKSGKLESTLKRIEQTPELIDMVKDPDILIQGGDLLASILKGNPFSVVKKGWAIKKSIARKMRGETAAPEEISYAIE